MSRITKPLTATEISAARPSANEYTLRDGGGLYLRIKPNGSKIWLFDYYRPITKKRTNMGFGVYPIYLYLPLVKKEMKPDVYWLKA